MQKCRCFLYKFLQKWGDFISTFLDFAIGLSLVNGISGQINNIINDFRNLDGVTDDVMQQLSGLANISITGGLLAGAGVAGLKLTADALEDCIDEAMKLQSVSTTLEIKAFGNDLLDKSKLPQIKEQMEELENTAMNVSLGTVFNAQQIEESMISMVKGGMSKELVGGLNTGWENSAAAANAYFAQLNRVNPVVTADATVQFSSAFQLDEGQIKDSLDLVTKYADASTTDALRMQQAIGNTAGTAMSVWRDRNNMEVAEETMQLIAATKIATGDEAAAATLVRNFLDSAGMKFNMMTDRQVEAMMDAGWLQNPVFEKGKMTEAQNIFIDYDTGMLKNAAELERILEETSQKLDPTTFNNLVDVVFGDRGKRTAQELAKKGVGTDISVLQKVANVEKMGIDEQVEREMKTLSGQMLIFEESINTVKSTLGKPFLDPLARSFEQLNSILGTVTAYFSEHPEVTKFMVAITGGVSGILLFTGVIMSLVGVVGSLKLVFALAGPQIAAFFAPVLPILATVIMTVLVIAGIAFIVYKNWSILKPQFETLFSSLSGLLKAVGNRFENFGVKAISALQDIWNRFAGVALWIINIAVPLISDGLDFITQILTGDFKGAWESMNPLERILTLILAPSILVVTGAILMMTAAAIADTTVKLGLAAATKIAAGADLLWNGIKSTGIFIQTAWNIAMNGGVAATIAQKIAVAALYPIMLIVKGATLLWTGVQWALNAAMMAFPGSWIIIAILAVIGTVLLLVNHFKEIYDWIVKAWDKLKGFLGFKKEAKEELEAPINITINENGEEQVIPVTQEKVEFVPALQNSDMIKSTQQSVSTIQVPVEVLLDLRNFGMSDKQIKQTLGLPEDYQIPVDLQISEAGNEQMVQQYEDGMAFVPQIDLSQAQDEMANFTQSMNILGIDSTNGLAQGLNSSDALGVLGTSINDINNIITSGLIKNDEMEVYGGNLIQSFIDGINAKSAVLKSVVQGISNIIGDYLAVHSPTKSGPLHTNQLWGGNLIQSFVNGIYDKNFQLSTAVSSVAQELNKINEIKYAGKLFNNVGNLEELQSERYFSRNKENMASNFFRYSNTEQKENQKISAPIYIMIQGADKNQEEIAKVVAKELEKCGLGQRKRSSDFPLTMSPYGFRMGY